MYSFRIISAALLFSFALSNRAKSEGKAMKTCEQSPTGMRCVAGGIIKIVEKLDNTKTESASLAVNTFYIDSSAVTNADYSKCIKMRRCSRLRYKKASLSAPDLPARASWYQAFNYCKYMGKRLPTELEFDLAHAKKTQTNAEWVNDWGSSCRLKTCKKSCGSQCLVNNAQGPCDGKYPCGRRKLKLYKVKSIDKATNSPITFRKTYNLFWSSSIGFHCASSTNYLKNAPGWMLSKPFEKRKVPLAKLTTEQFHIAHNIKTDVLDKPLCKKPFRSSATCRDPVSYVKGNEGRHFVFAPYTKNLGGGYMGAAADANYSMIASAQSSYVWLFDFDLNINRLHRFLKAFIKASKTRKEFVGYFSFKNRIKAKKVINQEFNNSKKAKFIYGVYLRYRKGLYPYYRGKMRKSRSMGSYGWLRNAENYNYIRDLHLANRIAIVKGDMTKATTMRSIGAAAKKLGIKIRIYYSSNAEEYFPLSANYKANVAALPFDEASIVIRSVHIQSWHGKFKGVTNYWHYVVHGALAFQARLRNRQMKHIHEFKDYKILPGPYRDLSTIELPNTIPSNLSQY